MMVLLLLFWSIVANLGSYYVHNRLIIEFGSLHADLSQYEKQESIMMTHLIKYNGEIKSKEILREYEEL